ncbi:BsuPI-related putative proteinase inhibitor [Bacillus sp. FJAT-45066]|uniref:BsuPI-related putative proteinase inhibitor n=1 Tax=Bacillus sp. FJAT-45066 TaxID=2011010 RepID=UPI0015964FEE|nr:BsuPI-related putative proteinase inhibitor [Bacillus sp. FJAT-45066]
MMKKIPFFVLSSIMVASLLTGCGVTDTNTGAKPKDPEHNETEVIAGEVVRDATITNEGNGSVKVVFTVDNQTADVVKIDLSSGLSVDYILYDSAGNKMYQLSEETLATLALQTIELKQGEKFEEEIEIGALPAGDYSIDVFLNNGEKANEVKKQFTVSNDSMYQRIQAEYVKKDGSLIEIAFGEEKLTYRLTDFAAEQLNELAPGPVDFIYHERVDLQTIERFIPVEGLTYVKTEKSVLEVNDQLVKTLEKVKESKSSTPLEGLEPFEVFALYMYTQAGEDYETLYYFYPEGALNISVEQFVKEGKDVTNTENTQAFMKKLNEVRDFSVITKGEEGRVIFKQDGDVSNLTFQMVKQNGIWHVHPMPLQ